MCFWDTKHAGICLQIVYEFPKFKCSLLWTYFVPRWDLWNLQTWRQHRAKKSLHMSLQFNLFRISKKIFAYFLLNCLKIYQNCRFLPLCECTSFTDGISGISRQSGNIGGQHWAKKADGKLPSRRTFICFSCASSDTFVLFHNDFIFGNMQRWRTFMCTLYKWFLRQTFRIDFHSPW